MENVFKVFIVLVAMIAVSVLSFGYVPNPYNSIIVVLALLLGFKTILDTIREESGEYVEKEHEREKTTTAYVPLRARKTITNTKGGNILRGLAVLAIIFLLIATGIIFVYVQVETQRFNSIEIEMVDAILFQPNVLVFHLRVRHPHEGVFLKPIEVEIDGQWAKLAGNVELDPLKVVTEQEVAGFTQIPAKITSLYIPHGKTCKATFKLVQEIKIMGITVAKNTRTITLEGPLTISQMTFPG